MDDFDYEKEDEYYDAVSMLTRAELELDEDDEELDTSDYNLMLDSRCI